MAPRAFPKAKAETFAAEIDVDLDAVGICFACPSFVSFALDDGDAAEVSRQLRRMTPVLWDEGLADPALAAVRRASRRGIRDAKAALADLLQRRGRSAVARAIVRRLAEDLSRRSRVEMELHARVRGRLRVVPPELNEADRP